MEVLGRALLQVCGGESKSSRVLYIEECMYVSMELEEEVWEVWRLEDKVGEV